MRKEWFLNENVMSRLEIPWVLHNTDFYVCKVMYSEVPIIATSSFATTHVVVSVRNPITY